MGIETLKNLLTFLYTFWKLFVTVTGQKLLIFEFLQFHFHFPLGIYFFKLND